MIINKSAPRLADLRCLKNPVQPTGFLLQYFYVKNPLFSNLFYIINQTKKNHILFICMFVTL